MRSAKFKTLYGTFYKRCYTAINNISYKQRLHFRWVSWHAKCSLPPTTVQFSIVHARNSSLDSQAKLTALNRSRTGKIVFFLMYSSRFLDGIERLSAEATLRTTQRKCSLCSQGTNKSEMPYSFIVYVAICEFLGLP